MILEIEINSPHNRNWSFPALERRIRGRFILLRCAEPEVVTMIRDLPPEIPGQRLRIDTEKREGTVVEPLHDDPVMLQLALKNKMKLEPRETVHRNVDADVWLYWMKRVVEAKQADVIAGEVPETVNYAPPDDPNKPKLRGEKRLQQIFQEPGGGATAMEFMRMSPEEQEKWKSLVGA